MSEPFRVFQRQWHANKTLMDSFTDKDRFTVGTYNVLSDTAIPDGEYVYCPKDIRYMKKRHPRIIAEVEEFGFDIICMQEVTEAHYRDLLEPDMRRLGFAGLYKAELPNHHSVAMFFASKKFDLIDHKSCLLHDAMEKSLKDVTIDEDTRREMSHFIKGKHSAVLAKLRHKASGRDLGVANIHATWDQLLYPALQALQIITVFKELLELLGGTETPHIFCGDFNTPPDFPAYQMLRDGQLSDEMADKARMLTEASSSETNEKKTRIAKDMVNVLRDLYRHDSSLASAYYTIMGEEPSITNCDDACQSYLTKLCLDYLWFSQQSLDVLGVLENPPDEAILKHYGLPSVLFPSDHIPQKAEFAFR